LKKNSNRLLYYFFYILFSVDTWRLLIGFVLALIFGPMLTAEQHLSLPGRVVVWLMILAIGYAVGHHPARYISRSLRRLFTDNRL
jgi:hypothetical protein